MTLRKNANQRTADLLTAAERVLEARGRVTVADVTREAGIASGTFYLYFPSKAHLEATLIERFIEGYVESAEKAVSTGGDMAERLGATLLAMVRASLAHPAVLRLHATHTPTAATRETIAACVDRMKSLLTRIMLEGQSNGEAGVPDPEMTAAMLFHGIEGILCGAAALDRDVDEARLAATVRSHVRHLVGSGIVAG